MSRSSEEKDGIRYDSQFLRIEELIKGKTFSREEISHLVEILNSRVDIELEKQSKRDARGDTELVELINEIPRTIAGVQHVTDRITLGTFFERSDVPVGVGASPIDIARAYMAGRTSEQGHDLHSYSSKGERAESSNKFSRQPLVPSPLPKPSICWPGAVLNDHQGYTTPQSHSGRYGLRDFSRTPYARPISSRSTTKLHANSRFANASTPTQRSPTSVYGQVKSRADSIDVYGSVGPIRRSRNKFASEVRPRESVILSSPLDVPSGISNSKFLSGFLPSTGKKLEPGETSGTSKHLSDDNVSGFSGRIVPNENSISSPAVQKILEHLNRNNPTPKEKEAEIKLVTEWRIFSSEASQTTREKNMNSLNSMDLASHKNAGLSGLNIPVEFNKSSSGFNHLVKPNDEGMDMVVKDVVNVNPKPATTSFTGSGTVPGANAMPSLGLEAPSGSVVKNLNMNNLATSHGQEKRVHFSSTNLNNGPDLKAASHSTVTKHSENHGTKPSLPSIYINKPEFRAGNSVNGSDFTFPFCAAAGVLSEPPTTPSFLPSASITPQPTYSFGANKSNPSLVFSFPSGSNASSNDASDLKFSFGSDKGTRLSFSSFNKDTICY